MQHVMIKTTTPPDMARALADGALIAENAKLREELLRVTNERDMLLWARNAENGRKLAEARTRYGKKPSLTSRVRDVLAILCGGGSAIIQSACKAARGH